LSFCARADHCRGCDIAITADAVATGTSSASYPASRLGRSRDLSAEGEAGVASITLNGERVAMTRSIRNHKRQLAREGIAYQALDNGVLGCAVPQPAADLRRPVGPALGSAASVRTNLGLSTVPNCPSHQPAPAAR
jgi:hypothetical protein